MFVVSDGTIQGKIDVDVAKVEISFEPYKFITVHKDWRLCSYESKLSDIHTFKTPRRITPFLLQTLEGDKQLKQIRHTHDFLTCFVSVPRAIYDVLSFVADYLSDY